MDSPIDFRKMPTILPYKNIIDKAFSKASKAVDTVSAQNRLLERRIKELKRVETATRVAEGYLNKILENTPYINMMPPYYVELVSLIVDKGQFKKSMAAIKWACGMIKTLEIAYKKKIKGAQGKDLARIRGEFYGRMSSVLKQIRRDLVYLEDSRINLKNMPRFKQMKTVVIAGIPNVGKSSILKAITGAEPDIQSYPFTTKTVRVGYLENSVQLVDTPGLLDRSFERRSKIEFHAIIALTYLADMILYVFDPSETCGYVMEEQMNLFEELKKEFDIPFVVCFNKTDISDAGAYKKGLEKLGENVFLVSVLKNKGISELSCFFVKDIMPSKKKFYENA
ncbi:MAG: GTPase [archaeon]|nr:GTPase [archaeon]